MIDVKIGDEGLEQIELAGTPTDFAGELSFLTCFIYGQLYSENPEGAELFRRAFLGVVEEPIAWRQLIPDAIDAQGEDTESSEENKEPTMIDFAAELAKRKHK